MRRAIQRPESHLINDLLIILLLAAVCYVFFFHGLWSIGLLGPDEPRYAAVAREMYQTGDYITPRLHGTVWFEKPALLYWAAAASFGVFGVNEFAARFPSGLAASICVFFTYVVCRKLWGKATAIAASFILASCVGHFAFARATSMDMLLTACLTSALFSFLIGYNSSDRRRRWWFAVFYACLGLGLLAKGPVALALPAISLAGYLLFQGRRDEWKDWYPLYALLILAVALPWYAAVIHANGWKFVDDFFINHNFERFTTTVHGHQQPFYFYVPDLMMLAFPWTFMIIPGLRRTFDRNDKILLWFAVVPIVFFSLSGSKLPGYILPSIPPMVLLIVRSITNESSRPFRIAVYIQAGTMLFIGVAFGFFGEMLNVDPHVGGLKIALISFVMAAALAGIATWMTPPVLVVFNSLTMTLIVLVATTFVLPKFETTDTMRPWRSVLQAMVPADQTVFLYRPSRWMEYGMQFYRYNKVQGVWTPEELRAVMSSNARALFVADDKGLAQMGEVAGIQIKIERTVGNQSVFWVKATD